MKRYNSFAGLLDFLPALMPRSRADLQAEANHIYDWGVKSGRKTKNPTSPDH
jgi:hypothetical protein